MNQYHIQTYRGPIILTTDAAGTILTMDRKRWRRWVGRSIVEFRKHLEGKGRDV